MDKYAYQELLRRIQTTKDMIADTGIDKKMRRWLENRLSGLECLRDETIIAKRGVIL